MVERVSYQVNDDVDIGARIERRLDSLVVLREEGLVDAATESGGHLGPCKGYINL